MSLKSIRESYSKLLTTFNDAGIKLNESQKSDLDSFIMALESTMSKQRQEAIRKTVKATKSKCESEFKTLFESIMKNMQENSLLASKIQDVAVRLQESKKISNSVNDYLDLYVESVLPKKTIVDYDRMRKLETIQESLKNMLLLDEDSVAAKKMQLEESFKKQKNDLETQCALMKAKLNESTRKQMQLSKKLDQYKAMDLLESKTQDLPAYEARQIKKRLAESSTSEIEKKFDKVLESVRTETNNIGAVSTKTLDEEINNIVDEVESEIEENDILDGRVRNGHIPVNEYEEGMNHIDEFETIEEVQYDADGDVVIDESEQISPELMARWCSQSIERT